MRRTIAILTLVSLVVAGAATDADAKKAKRKRSRPPLTDISCEMVVAASIRANNDLTCDGDGLVVGAPGITLDLNGHTIDGSPGSSNLGITNAGHDGVTIKKGTVTGFDVGVHLSGADDGKIAKLEVSDSSSSGIFANGGSRNVVKKNVVTSNFRFGIALFLGSENVVTRNVASQNGMTSSVRGSGIGALSSSDNVLKRNNASRNGDTGILLRGSGATGNVVRANTAHDTGGNTATPTTDLAAGIFAHAGAAENTISGNRTHDNELVGVGVVESANNVLEGNRAKRNPYGIVVLDAAMNDVTRNRTDKNALGILIVGSPDIMGTSDTTLTKNRASRNDAVGIAVLDGSSRSTLVKNVANRNGSEDNEGDGIHATVPGTTFTKNKANRNFDLGIQAAEPSEGEGNIARKNGNRAQCSPEALC